MSAPLVVVTRDEGPEGALTRRLAALGAAVWPLPCTATAPPGDPGPLDTAIAALPSFDWLVLTSARAVSAALERPGWEAAWSSRPRPRIAAVGRATAARLADAGVPVDHVGGGGGAALARSLVESGVPLAGVRVLWPRADRARRELAQALAAAGAELSDPVAYRTLVGRPGDLELFRERLAVARVAAVTFASPSAAEGLAEALGAGDLAPLRGRTLVASLGPTTSGALAERGAPPDLEAAEPSLAALAEAVMGRLRVPTGASP